MEINFDFDKEEKESDLIETKRNEETENKKEKLGSNNLNQLENITSSPQNMTELSSSPSEDNLSQNEALFSLFQPPSQNFNEHQDIFSNANNISTSSSSFIESSKPKVNLFNL